MKILPLNVDYRGLHRKLRVPTNVRHYDGSTVDILENVLHKLRDNIKRKLTYGICSEVDDDTDTSLYLRQVIAEHFKQITGCYYVSGYWWINDCSTPSDNYIPEKWYAPRIKFIKMLINFYKKLENENI